MRKYCKAISPEEEEIGMRNAMKRKGEGGELKGDGGDRYEEREKKLRCY